MNFDFCLRIQFDGMEVQQMSFDGERLRTKRRAVSDVGDRIETLSAHPGTGNVNAIARHKFVIRAQVDRGNGVFGAVTATAAGGRQNTEGARQQMTSTAYSSVGQQFANLRARNRFAAQPQFWISLHLETHLATEVFKQTKVAGRLVAEMEVVTFVHLASVQAAL